MPSGAPFTESIDGDITGRYGYKDGHVDLSIRLPAPLSIVKKEYTHSFTEAEFLRFKASVDRIAKWFELPQDERERLGAP
jgi:hypothetical protein